ncbi:MAG: M60 family metallopeptidase, partial [Odoribacteraceae bacterium]|nr:M60 family metallopeptidase [Odoribacteraceae bacterium]
MKRIVYIAWLAGALAGVNACQEKEYDLIVSATDDYTGDAAADYHSREGIDVSMYAKARIFPGLVDTAAEERLDEVIIELDLTRKALSAANMNLAYLPSAIYSTGLYAGAGEKITVQMDEDIKGLSVQVGIHTRDISSLEAIERDPLLTTTMPLFRGKTEIRNPWGGYIWINRSGSDGADRPAFPLKISGAYAAPDFVPGETRADAWVEKIKATSVPWIELRGEHYVFSVPAKYIQKKVNESGETFAARLEEALGLWDEWMRCIYDFHGLDDTDPDFPLPDYPVRAVMDVHLQNERYSYYNVNLVELLQTEELIDMITTPEAIKRGDQNTVHLMGWLQLYILKQARSINTFATLPDAFSTVYPLLPNFYFLYKNGWWEGTNRVVRQYRVGGTQVIQWGTSHEMTIENVQNLISFAAAD